MEQLLTAKHVSGASRERVTNLANEMASHFLISSGDKQSGSIDGKAFPFLGLPLDIRVIIYSYVLSWPTLTREATRMIVPANLMHYYKHLPAPGREKGCVKPKMITPAILLVNRQIKDEALGELARMPIVIDNPPLRAAIPSRPFKITEFISLPLLKSCRRVSLTINTNLTPGNDLLVYRSDLQYWKPWEQCLSALFLDVWAPGTHNMKILDVEIGGVWSAKLFQDREFKKQAYRGKRSHRLKSKCYRESVLEQLRYGLQSLGPSVRVTVQAPDGKSIKHLLTRDART